MTARKFAGRTRECWHREGLTDKDSRIFPATSEEEDYVYVYVRLKNGTTLKVSFNRIPESQFDAEWRQMLEITDARRGPRIDRGRRSECQ